MCAAGLWPAERSAYHPIAKFRNQGGADHFCAIRVVQRTLWRSPPLPLFFALVCLRSRGPPGGPRRPMEGPRIAQGVLPGTSRGPGARLKPPKNQYFYCRAPLSGRDRIAPRGGEPRNSIQSSVRRLTSFAGIPKCFFCQVFFWPRLGDPIKSRLRPIKTD